jgi:uncharacterized protein YeaO (DUF488 family)
MKLYTSYWKNEALALPPYNKALKVGISRGGPRGLKMPYKYRMLRAEPFAPSKNLLSWWRRPGTRTSEDEEVYEREYLLQLEEAGVERIAEQLEDKAAGASGTVILLCHEEPGEFCHRRLFARWWQETTGQEIPEL